ncbi:MAG: hypothetical protein ACRD2J_05615 [Thermoanaerobaculia bacterium]
MKKGLFAFGTLVPIVYGVALLFVGFSGSRIERALDAGYPVIIVVALVTWIMYLVDVWRNAALEAGRKGLWTGFLIFGSIFAEIAYLWLHILRVRREPRSAS